VLSQAPLQQTLCESGHIQRMQEGEGEGEEGELELGEEEEDT
jgi:hypothetical protein